MRQTCIFLILLSLAACSRGAAPVQVAASSALASPPAATAQVAPSATATLADSAPVAKSTGALAAALQAPREDSRWRDVDPADLAPAAGDDPALAEFHDAQQKRDADLMAQDSEEAAQQLRDVDDRERGDDRYRDDRDAGVDRYAGDPRYAARRESRARERAQADADDRQSGTDGRDYRDDSYPNQDEAPAAPDDDYGDDQDDTGPPPDGNYDPRDYAPPRR